MLRNVGQPVSKRIISNWQPANGEAPLTWNRLRHFHKEPGAIAAWRKLMGPALRWATPPRRRFLLGLAAIGIAIKRPLSDLGRHKGWIGPLDWMGSAVLVVTVFGFVCLCYVAAKRFASLPVQVRRHPQICLHAIFWALLVLLWSTSISNPFLRTVLFGWVCAFPFLLWHVGYMMFTAQRGKMAGTRLTDHLAYIFPVWGGSDVPYGKGWDYLSANEAKNEDALARSQLSALKLFLLGACCSIAEDILAGIVYGKSNGFSRVFGSFSPAVPRVNEMFVHPELYSKWLCWVALYAELLRHVLSLGAYGHIVIGWLRLFGFNVFRNTYKPLLTETVVQFWNCYYYYFKELVVNFFFYPTFTRCFKQHARLRIFAAVFMAAFVGNMYYHILGKEQALATGDLRAIWMTLQSRFFYCFLLAFGIWISMLREQRRDKTKPRKWPRRLLAIFGVWTFFAIIRIWDQKDQILFVTRMKFFLGLLGLN